MECSVSKNLALTFTLQREYFSCLDNLHRHHLEVFLIPKPTPELNGIQKIQQRICAMCIVCIQTSDISGLKNNAIPKSGFVRSVSKTNANYSKRFTLDKLKFLSNPFIQLKTQRRSNKSLRSTLR